MGIDNLRHTNRVNKKTDAKKLDLYIERIANYDKDALAGLYHMTSASVYSFALSLLKNIQDAEDVLHDTYLQVYKTAASYKSMNKPLAWILTIARNLSLMKLRNRKKIVDSKPQDWNSAFEAIPSVTAEDRLVLVSCMDKLTDEERQIIMLHTVSGYKHREVAGFLKIPLSTALSKYHRAIKKLRILLSEEN
ncbi:MAG: RNA polymerase sigma factor [Clostridiales bacterium]|jgi:RNA polymerase sigma-70 factor (ECF subfamily)|nr:RNA polymerase sigma factor [Clostridia bacterium]MDI9512171.1 RNA polymerase sigma factor [Bacillota bacterium]NLH58741.1 RNA polymerase sigma factor [Clostridiales bacterium]